MVLSTDAPAAIEEARNSVAEALRALQDLVSHPAVAATQAMATAEPTGDRVPVQSSGSDSRWELIGNWADYPPPTTHRWPAPTYAKALWKMAVKKILRLLRLRTRWADLGRLLQRENCGQIFDRVERVNGRLQHRSSKGIGRQGPHRR